MKFAHQTIRHADPIATKAGGIISLFLWLLSTSKLNVKRPTVKMLEGRRVLFNLFCILYSKQLNRKSVRR